jgi:hypothetical protein
MSTSTSWFLARLQKYINHACSNSQEEGILINPTTSVATYFYQAKTIMTEEIT